MVIVSIQNITALGNKIKVIKNLINILFGKFPPSNGLLNIRLGM